MESGVNVEDVLESVGMDVEDRILKRCRLPRRQVVQSKKFCAKDERNASLKKVQGLKTSKPVIILLFF